MKSLFLSLSAAVLLSVLPAPIHAQDAPAPFRGNIPAPVDAATPTPAPRPTPAATVTPNPTPRSVAPPTPAPSATPEAKASPTETAAREKRTEPASTPRRRALVEEPVRSIEPRKSFIQRLPAERNKGPRASEPTFNFAPASWVTAATIRSLENKWADAIKSHDADAVEQLLARDFVATSASGEKASRSRLLALLRQDKNEYRSVRAHRMIVRAEAGDKVIVTGLATESGVTKGGKKFKTTRHFTDTWRERAGRWQCIASHVTETETR